MTGVGCVRKLSEFSTLSMPGKREVPSWSGSEFLAPSFLPAAEDLLLHFFKIRSKILAPLFLISESKKRHPGEGTAP